MYSGNYITLLLLCAPPLQVLRIRDFAAYLLFNETNCSIVPFIEYAKPTIIHKHSTLCHQ